MTRPTALKYWMLFTRTAMVIMALIVFAPSSAQAWDDDKDKPSGPPYHPVHCNELVHGNVVLNQDLNCVDLEPGAHGGVWGLKVDGDNTTIRLNGFSINCFDMSGYKFSCQGGDPGADYGIDTDGFSNVKIQGPGMIKGWTVGVYVRGFKPPANTGPSARNVKVSKVNVTGPDGRGDISDNLLFPQPRPTSFAILVTDFVDTPNTCSRWNDDDGHGHGVEVFGNSVENHVEGIALYNSSRVNMHENFVHTNNDAGEATTEGDASVPNSSVSTTYETHGIVICANSPFCTTPGGSSPPNISQLNKVFNNLVVDNGQNSYTDASCAGPSYEPGKCNVDSGITMIGTALRNDVSRNTVMSNNGDGISVRSGANYNKIRQNTSLMNSSTDQSATAASSTCTTVLDPFTGMLSTVCNAAPPPVQNFWDISNRAGGGSNYFDKNNRCLTQESTVPAGVCGPGENDDWQ